jgi:hypothetical protein
MVEELTTDQFSGEEEDDSDRFESLPFETLAADPYKAALAVSADLDHFLNLSFTHKKKIYNMIKAVKPYPEFKEDHKWICGYMKEEIEYLEENEDVNGEVEQAVVFCPPEDCGLIVSVIQEEIAKIKALPKINNYQRGRWKGYKEILEFMGL